MTLIQIWKDDSGITTSTKKGCDILRERGLLEKDAELLFEFEAYTNLEMAVIREQLLGHGPYSPMLDENGDICSFYFDPIEE